MKTISTFLILLLFSILLNGQNLIKGQIVDQYGNNFIADVTINNQKVDADFETGVFEYKTEENNVVINIKFQFYLSMKYNIELTKKKY